MSASQALLLTFLIGVVAGLRSVTAPAVVAWAAHRNWINLRNTSLFFMGSTGAVVIFTLLAIVELIADQLPSTPSRTKPLGLIARIIFGGLSGAAIGLSGGHSFVFGAVLGAAGAMVEPFAGYRRRTRPEGDSKVQDFANAFLEDMLAMV